MAKILVSDDDRQVLRMVSRALESAGHEVAATSDSREVLSMAGDVRPDVIVLDVLMPVSGFELLGGLRDDPRTASVPILFLSGLGEAADRVRGLREGADDYLVKPFDTTELLLRVEKLISWRDAAAPEPVDPSRLGRYELLGILGEGSMGTVYRGRDPRLEREVALKTIRLEAATSERRRQELLELLRHEAVTIARLSHPNIVAVYDMGDSRDSAFVAMELIDGPSLGELLRADGPLTADRLLPLALGVARGLEVTHSRGVIHRDVKPGNVLLGRDGEIKVTDFGLAHVVSALLEDSTELSGTPGYVPPEVLEDNSYTEAGDVFGFGAMLYEALAGHHPLVGDSLRTTILNTLAGRVKPLRDLVPDLPETLGRLIESMLSLDPDARPTAEQVAQELDRMVRAEGLVWRPDGLPARTSRPLPTAPGAG